MMIKQSEGILVTNNTNADAEDRHALAKCLLYNVQP